MERIAECFDDAAAVMHQQTQVDTVFFQLCRYTQPLKGHKGIYSNSQNILAYCNSQNFLYAIVSPLSLYRVECCFLKCDSYDSRKVFGIGMPKCLSASHLKQVASGH